MATKKATVRYVCSNCGAISSTWAGRCFQCGEWNTLQEEVLMPSMTPASGGNNSLTPQLLSEVPLHDQERFPSGIHDVDDVLGGGFVPGSVSLLTGQPGIGKSTLLLQLAANVAKQAPVLYVSGEESAQQIGLRARRLQLKEQANLNLATASLANDVAATIASGKYSLVIVDSIQTMTVAELSSAAGTVSQISASAQFMLAAAKQSETAVVFVGHVTKEGTLAGPKVLEHMVDVVLQFEGEAVAGFKVLRATKNRFGSTNEAAIFEMQQGGLRIVDNPSAALLSERQVTDGSVVLATMEGTRPLLVEVQALVNPTSYGYPKRAASGIDLTRVNLLVAVLERRTSLKLSDQDIYINIVGGIRLADPAADLAVCMAIGSAARGLRLKSNAVVFGEVGLSGEIRRVPFIDKRIQEAQRLGFEAAIGPKPTGKSLPTVLQPVPDIRTALNEFLEKP